MDGPKAMLSTTHLKTLASGGGNADMAWTGSSFGFNWFAFEEGPMGHEINISFDVIAFCE